MKLRMHGMCWSLHLLGSLNISRFVRNFFTGIDVVLLMYGRFFLLNSRYHKLQRWNLSAFYLNSYFVKSILGNQDAVFFSKLNGSCYLIYFSCIEDNFLQKLLGSDQMVKFITKFLNQYKYNGLIGNNDV